MPRWLIALTVAIGLALPVQAAGPKHQFESKPFTANFTVDGFPRCGFAENEAGFGLLYWKARIQIGSLMGGALVSSTFNWNLRGGGSPGATVCLPHGLPGRDPVMISLSDIMDRATEERLLSVYDVELQVVFHNPKDQDRYGILIDAGAIGKANQWSFNVPGSPDWDEMFFVHSIDNMKGVSPNYVDRKKAIEIFKEGEIVDVHLNDIKVSAWDAMHWWRKNNKLAETVAMVGAVNRIREGVRTAYGLYLEDYEYNVYDDRVFMHEVPRQLKWKYERLSDIPERFRSGRDSTYEQVQSDARGILSNARRFMNGLPVGGVDVSRLRRGRPPVFGDSGLTPVTIRGPLEFRIWDHGSEDGDKVDVVLIDEFQREVWSKRNLRLSARGHGDTVRVSPGVYQLSVKALNQGSSGENTGKIRLQSQIVDGQGTQQYDLRTGEEGTMLMTVLP